MKAILLDRDGTIVEDRGYITIPDDVRILPGVAEAIVELRSQGWKVMVVSNQAAVAKGLITEEELGEINLRMVTMLGAEGAILDGVYVCPHHPEGKVPDYAIECGCRKPRTGLLDQAAAEHGLDLSECVIVGDSLRDLEAGRAAGLKAAILVLTGHGAKTAAGEHGADFVAPDLAAAARWLGSL
ncbi:MAG TPA: HAD-IIIA family hydrolase [Planctomycetota bacterium]|nr:HAD-IIIA family hydrolase [Planctomycetota bacterium]